MIDTLSADPEWPNLINAVSEGYGDATDQFSKAISARARRNGINVSKTDVWKAAKAQVDGPVVDNLSTSRRKSAVERHDGTTARSVARPEAKSGYDLMFEVFAAFVWVLAEMIPEGTILIAGKPKSGKSWFVLNLMLSAVLQINFLRAAVANCAALYLALEENPRRMRQRIELLMHLYPDKIECLKQFEYRCDWPPGAIGADLLDQYLTAHPNCKIVSIDVLKKIRPVVDGRRNAYELDYEAIEPWKAVADKHRVTLLLVHHTRKAEADDVFDEVSGTLGINGAVDQIVVLKRIAGEDKKATLHMRGRDLPDDHELGIELKDGWWELIGSAKELAANDARRMVMEVLAESDHPMTTGEIMKATGKKSRPSTSRLLAKMVRDGLIRTEGKGYVSL